MRLTIDRNRIFVLGTLLILSGVLVIALAKGSELFPLACSAIALGLILPFLSQIRKIKGKVSIDAKETKLPSLKICMVIGLLIQLSMAPFFYDVYNSRNWLRAANIFSNGANPYQFCQRLGIFDMFPYPAMFLYLMLLGRQVFQVLGQTGLALFFKSLLIMSNLLAGGLVFRAVSAQKGSNSLARNAACLYIFNPLLIFVTSVQGEFDSIVIMLTVLAAYLFVVKKKSALSALSLGIGISLKLYPLFLLPFFLARIENWKQRVIFALLSAIPMIVSSVPFLILDYVAYISVAFNTGGGSGPLSPWQSWLGGFFAEPLLRLAFTLSLFGALSVGLLILRGQELFSDFFLCLICVYATIPFIHENHVTWILPFIVLGARRIRLAHIASLFPFLHLLLFTGAFGSSGLPYWLSSWVGADIASRYSLYNVVGRSAAAVLDVLIVVCFLAICYYVVAESFYLKLRERKIARESDDRLP